MNLPIALLALGLVTPQDAAPDAASGAQAASDARGTLGEGVPEGFIVRPGYHVTLAAGDLEEARFIEFGEEGVLYVSMPQTGKIQALKDEDGDGVYESRTDFAMVMGSLFLLFAGGGRLSLDARRSKWL